MSKDIPNQLFTKTLTGTDSCGNDWVVLGIGETPEEASEELNINITNLTTKLKDSLLVTNVEEGEQTFPQNWMRPVKN